MRLPEWHSSTGGKELQDTVAESQAKTVEALRAVREIRERVATSGWEKGDIVFNVIEFCFLFNFDLSTLIGDVAKRSSGEWAAKMYARFLVITVHQCAESLTPLLGRDLQAITNEWCGSIALSCLRDLNKELVGLRRKNHSSFLEIRNNTIAHREKDARAQISVIDQLDSDAIAEEARLYLNWLTRLQNLMSQILAAKIASMENNEPL